MTNSFFVYTIEDERIFYPLFYTMNKSFIKNLLISGWVILATTWVAVFAQTTIETNVYNAVQTIMRTIYTDDGSAGGTPLVDINNDDGHIYIDQSVLAAPTNNNLYLWLNSNNEVTVMSGGGWTLTLSGEQDSDRYQVGTTQAPMSINDDIYTLWSAGIQTSNPNANLQVVGNITFGDINNFAGYPNDNMFNSVLWWLWNHIETERSSIAGWHNNNIVADADNSFIGWWWHNTTHARASTIGWWEYNTINNWYATAYATIGWWRNNTVLGETSTIGGWGYNIISKSFSVIAWWFQNGGNGNYSSILWGRNNVANAWWSTIVWWDLNNISNLWAAWFIGWWVENWISNNNGAVVGWYRNIVHGASSILWWGEENIIEGWTMNSLLWWRLNTIKQWDWNAIVWWSKNFIDSFLSFIWGWQGNIINGSASSIVWGYRNRNDADQSIIWWGNNNTITASSFSAILGWRDNNIMGYSGIIIPNNYMLNTILWGNNNEVLWGSNMLWWNFNSVSWFNLFIGWGRNNTIEWDINNVVWGENNNIMGNLSSIVWGQNNNINSDGSEVIGSNNTINWQRRNLILWDNNNIQNSYTSIALSKVWLSNIINSSYANSFWSNTIINSNTVWSMGFNANFDGAQNSFFWNDGSITDTWTMQNIYIIWASNWVAINHTTPTQALDVNGNIKTQGTFVSPTDQPGISQTINLTDAQWSPCTMTVEAGIITATTCQ